MTLMTAPVVSIFDVGDYDEQLGRAVTLLHGGGVVVLPTETIYGAAGILGNDKAMTRLKAIRGNAAEGKPLTIHLARREQAMRYIGEVGEVGQRLMKKLWPGPVALQFDVPGPRRKEVAKQVGVAENEIYADGAITLRCPDHIVATDLLSRVDAPVVVTAAGPTAIEMLDKVDLALDAGATRFNKPSTMLKVKPAGFEIVRAGVYDERIIERLLRTTILFVCSGNTCRSPMGEALARAVLAKKLNVAPDDLEQKGISIISAGSFAMPGARATPQAVEAVKAHGGDLTKHRSRPLSVELIHQADAIFTMSRAHAAAVTALVPSAAEKTMTLDPDGDIDDPIGGDLSLYQTLAAQMQQLIEKRLEQVIS
ncbi:MAG: protein arginine phosphatase [Phycisphaerales bacterium]|jgi:protein-tyrosine phosphatase|nr:protein arginine phosphatase [Phycisphaerales bacterium]